MNKHQHRADRVAELIKPFPGKWVTVSADKTKVLGSSSKVEVALQKAQEKGEKHQLLIKVPDASTAAFLY